MTYQGPSGAGTAPVPLSTPASGGTDRPGPRGMTVEEPGAFFASVGVLNITVSGRNFNLNKLNYCWIYSEMQHYFPFPYPTVLRYFQATVAQTRSR